MDVAYQFEKAWFWIFIQSIDSLYIIFLFMIYIFKTWRSIWYLTRVAIAECNGILFCFFGYFVF